MHRSRNWLATLLLPLAAGLLGCSGGPARPEVYPVSGSLLINGEPAAGAILSLHPADGENFDQRGSRPQAMVGADGEFTVSTYGDGDGAPAGVYNVSVVWLENPESANPVDRLGGQLANPRDSQWQVRVEAGENRLEPHRIDGVRLARGRSSADVGSDDPVE